jgi:gamma-glutamyltranspeptidase/glutathione hydrolase
MAFHYNRKREWDSAAQRSVVMATHGMVATSQPLATQAGLRVLEAGGNAVDAAVAAAAVLCVVEPCSTGIGGDAFMLIHHGPTGELHGLNASGRAPRAISIEAVRRHGHQRMPQAGILSVTVPGALDGWVTALEKFGSWPLSRLLKEAIKYAEEGFPVSEVISGGWERGIPLLSPHPASASAYLMDGRAPRPGQRFANPDMAKTFRLIASGGKEVFYRGEIGRAIAEFFRQNGGFLSLEDLENNKSTWVKPISTDYRGYTLAELPPNGQGLAAIETVNIMEGYDVASMNHNSVHYLHLLLEAMKVAFADRNTYITDPEFRRIPVEWLGSKPYANIRRKAIDPRRAASSVKPGAPEPVSDTIYLTVVDRERTAVSFINSLFHAFGSGMVVPGTGIILQNRGSSFSLDPGHFNALEPGKRPMHTIIPAMVLRDGKFWMSFGVMGGDMQPQGHVQVLMNILDFGLNIQEAIDAPRIRYIGDNKIDIEEGIPSEVQQALADMGHEIIPPSRETNQFGGGQGIIWDETEDVLLGGSDRRKDGCAAGF